MNKTKSQMNKVVLIVAFIVTVLLLAAMFGNYYLKQNTKKHSPQAIAEFSDSNITMKIVYCQPYRKGRLLFGAEQEGALQPFGKYWRLGANEATTIETSRAITIGSETLPAGKYSIYAFPGKDSWAFGINKVSNRWGATEPDYTKDLFKVRVPVTYTQSSLEQFTISIEKNKIVFWWDTSKTELSYTIIE